MPEHMLELKSSTDTPKLIRKREVFGDPNTNVIQVYFSPLPVFYNTMVHPAFKVSQFTKTARLLEESAILHYYLPIINHQD
jgi:hypothetical protein